jgi:hypothetical protein
LGVVSIVSAFAVTGLVPLWSLALGPVVLGVPHLVSDVRYLVVRPGLHRRALLVVSLGAPLMATSLGAPPVVGALAMFPAVLVTSSLRGTWKLAVALVGCAALSWLAWARPYEFQLGFVHGHNLVAVALWWSLSSRTPSMAWIPALTLLGAVAIMAGALDPLVTLAGGWSAPFTRM